MSTLRLSAFAKGLRHFGALTEAQQFALVRALVRSGRTEESIARDTHLAVERVREILQARGRRSNLG
jgi:hypothetical protein